MATEALFHFPGLIDLVIDAACGIFIVCQAQGGVQFGKRGFAVAFGFGKHLLIIGFADRFGDVGRGRRWIPEQQAKKEEKNKLHQINHLTAGDRHVTTDRWRTVAAIDNKIMTFRLATNGLINRGIQ